MAGSRKAHLRSKEAPRPCRTASSKTPQPPCSITKAMADADLGFAERAFSAAGAALLSAVLVNPLDIAKGGIYLPCLDLFRNFMEDFTSQNAPNLTPHVPLVAGSAARSLACVTCYPIELARTRMQAFRETQTGGKPPGIWKTLHGAITPVKSTNYLQTLQRYCVLWTGLGAQLARNVPFSAICWSTLEPIRRRILGLVGDEARAATVLGANFSAGFVAGSLAAAATCPLDVARTPRQIEAIYLRQCSLVTSVDIFMPSWLMRHSVFVSEGSRTRIKDDNKKDIDGNKAGRRNRKLFTGIGPRFGHASPSVGIIVSSYQVVKYALQQGRLTSDSK